MIMIIMITMCFFLNRIIFKTTHVQLQSVARRLQSKMEINNYTSR